MSYMYKLSNEEDEMMNCFYKNYRKDYETDYSNLESHESIGIIQEDKLNIGMLIEHNKNLKFDSYIIDIIFLSASSFLAYNTSNTLIKILFIISIIICICISYLRLKVIKSKYRKYELMAFSKLKILDEIHLDKLEKIKL
ncbi:hypothetical protein IC216_14250 [Clostridioides sp. ES-S-0145-01]|uniref:hypothetical protein n=1 Tax=Clostridioides sp. ES-S-0145-01 TaxID=2770784 RepID=UPI001D115553|nr:hypothetical protein [Clostridioides sp. ES-S-0145-01]